MSNPSLAPTPHLPDAAQAHHSRRGHRIGLVLAIVLTAVPFWLVMTHYPLSASLMAATIFGLALMQIVVHVVCFLHVDTRSEGGWTLLAFLFTVVIVVLTIGGSVWVMFHLNSNMMPMPGGAVGPVR